MDVVDRFQRALTYWEDTGEAGPARMPTRLTKACVQVLPITGAGLSLFSAPTMRIPIGASDDTATAAERAQFTVAQGPCFAAHHTGGQVVAPESVIAKRWPLFYDLIAQTPVRGILSCPLHDGLSRVGVLDLYVPRSEDLADIDPAEIGTITAYITAALMQDDMFVNFRNGPPWDGPLWLTNPAVVARTFVMMAMGMVTVATGLRLDDALAALRAHAYAVDRTLDSIAWDIVHRNLPAASLADT
jgi:hypothetical protein